MKKTLLILVATLGITASASAQSFLSGLLGGNNSGSGSAVTNLLGSLANAVYSAPVSLDGTYTYNGVAISATSSDGNVLSSLAGTALTSQMEAKVDEKLAKFGIKPGSMTIIFNNSDNSFIWTVFGIPLQGTYKVGEGEKTVTMTFGKTMQYFCMTGNLNCTLTGADILFTAKKTLAFLKKVAAQVGKSNSELAAISQLTEGYDDFKIGFRLVK